jgi:hypothetical protein
MRSMTPEEIQEEAQFYRLHWYAYSDAKALLRDEFKITQDRAWVNQLSQILGEEFIETYPDPAGSTIQLNIEF